jgi:predicted phage terminase large subunit-like protein
MAEEAKWLTDVCRAELARESYLDYMRYVWQTTSPFVVGMHTRVIANRLDKALNDLSNDQSTYLIVTVPFRHGKSDLVSRYFPPYVFGRHPDYEIILATYNQDLSNDMSRDARAIMRSEEYQMVFESRIAQDSQSVAKWGIEKHKGKLQAVGMRGGATGKGSDVLIVDDYLKGREEAESQVVREAQWGTFSGNLMTRLAPCHIVVILATPWHVDDIIGRIKRRMDPEDEEYEEDYPQFELIKFPAMSDEYDAGYLFPERLSEEWYRMQFAQLGPYQSAGLLQCEPTIRGGNMLKVDGVQYYDEPPNDLLWVRVWDLASTEKERVKSDPDETAGAKVAVTQEESGAWHLWIDDVRTCQHEATERNDMIINTAEDDGMSVWQGVESIAGFKDAYTTLKKILKGKSVVHKVVVSGDKIVRAGEVEPIFEAGNVHVRKSWWNKKALQQIAEFPSGAHDDIVDAMDEGFVLARKRYQEQRNFGSKLGKGAV